MKNNFHKLLALFRLAAAFTVIVSVISTAYALIRHRGLIISNIFTVNFAVGAFIILMGLVIWVLPINFNKLGSKLLIDHSTIGPKTIEAKEERRKNALEYVYLGIGIILITGAAEWIVSLFTV